MKAGNLPEEITIIYSQHNKNSDGYFPAFISDSKNQKTLYTGRQWAARRNDNVSEKTEKNIPKNGYRINDLVFRNEGGRAYKVITPDGFYVDFREDILLETILEVGISPGGILNGKYLWATIGSQMKLIRDGSKLHQELINLTHNKKLKSIKKLEIGCIYSKNMEDYFLYLGQIKGYSLKEDLKKYTYLRGYELIKNEFSNHQMWLKIPSWTRNDDFYKIRSKEDLAKFIGEYYYRVERVKNKNVTTLISDNFVGEVDHNLIRKFIGEYKYSSYSNTEDEARKEYIKQYYEYEVV